jgi:hypothetical protein
MSNTKYEIKLNLTLEDLNLLQSGLAYRMEERSKEGYAVTDEARVYAALEQHAEGIRLTHEQMELDNKIKDLQNRKNELRA